MARIELSKDLEAARRTLAARERRMAILAARLDAAQRTATARRERIATLSEAITQRDRRIAGMLGSTSWRLTAPVRALGSWLGRRGRRRHGP